MTVAATITRDPTMQAVLADLESEHSDWLFCKDTEMWRLEPIMRPEVPAEYKVYEDGLKLYKKERPVHKKTGQGTMLSLYQNTVNMDTVTLVEQQHYKGMLEKWPVVEKQEFGML
jgi:hypothetical protein